MKKVVDMVRGMDVSYAIDHLQFAPQKAAHFISKTLKSAIANAEHNFSMKKDNLFISEIKTDQGPTLKRWRARAFGRAATIHRQISHLSVVLSEKKLTNKYVPRKEKVKEPVIQPVEKEKHELAEVEQKIDLPTKEKPRAKKIFDVRRKGKTRSKQHLDKVRIKGKGGKIKQIFRRKVGDSKN